MNTILCDIYIADQKVPTKKTHTKTQKKKNRMKSVEFWWYFKPRENLFENYKH